MESLFFLAVLIGMYFLPGFIASQRGRDHASTIAILNLLLGWTGIAWVVLLVLSLTGESAQQRRQREEELALLRQIAATRD